MTLLEFYQLKENPFSTAIDSRYFYRAPQLGDTLERLMNAAENMKGLAVVVGDVGTGKTMLATRLLEELEAGPYEAALLIVLHQAVTSEWMLRKIALQMDVEKPGETKTDLLTQLSQRLSEVYESGKKAVVLIDEAQMLRSRELMQDFRGLLNIEFSGRKAVTFVLFGLPELDEVLSLDRPLHQRIAGRYELTSLDTTGTEAYVNYRLRIAGADDTMFTPDTFAVIRRYSRGIPRLINTLCDNALLEGYLRKQDRLGADLIHEIARDLKLGGQGVER
jgi:type II secretory pathway predicted ATPase ExeA